MTHRDPAVFCPGPGDLDVWLVVTYAMVGNGNIRIDCSLAVNRRWVKLLLIYWFVNGQNKNNNLAGDVVSVIARTMNVPIGISYFKW